MEIKKLIEKEGANIVLNKLFDNLQDLIVEKLKQHNNKFYFKTNQDYDVDYSDPKDFSFLTAVNEWDLPHLHNHEERIVVLGVELVKEWENEHILYSTKSLNTGKTDKILLCFNVETLAGIYDLICKQE